MASLDEVIATVLQTGLATPEELLGCSPAEIENLEQKYQVRLPPTYRRLLELAGHRSGLLFRWDHLAAGFDHVWIVTEEERARLTEEESAPLPADALIICDRLGEQFESIRCGQGDESRVWYYAEWDPDARPEYESFLEWLNAQLDEAVDALNSGYFARYPNGTEP